MAQIPPKDRENVTLEVFLASHMGPSFLGAYLGLEKNGHEKALKLLEHFNVIPSRDAEYVCPTCNGMVKAYGDRSKTTGWKFRCAHRHVSYHQVHNTFLEQVMLNFTEADIFVKFIQCWLMKMPAKTTANCIGIAKDTAIAWYGYFQDVARKAAWHSYEAIGGPMDVVEVEEIDLYNRKHNADHETTSTPALLFMGISRTTKLICAMIVNDRTEENLIELMERHINKETYVCNDQLRSYDRVAEIFAAHGAVNRLKNKVKPSARDEPLWVPTGRFHDSCLDKKWSGKVPNGLAPFRDHTRHVKCAWRELMKHLRTCRRQCDLENFVGEWMYKRNILDRIEPFGGRFTRFLHDIQQAYPGIGKVKMNTNLADCHCHVCAPP